MLYKNLYRHICKINITIVYCPEQLQFTNLFSLPKEDLTDK